MSNTMGVLATGSSTTVTGSGGAIGFSTNPAPNVNSLSPNSVTAGAASFVLTVNGSGFVSGSTVRWNGASRTTTFVNSSQLRATVLAADLAVAGTAQVTVFTGPPGGGISGGALFSILPANNPALQFVPITPCRVVDTRAGYGFFGPMGPPSLAAASPRTIPISSGCSIPATAVAYSLNVTVVPLEFTLGFLTVWPAGRAMPVASILNSPDGSVIAAGAIVAAGDNGGISVLSTHKTELIIDINGYFQYPSSNSLQFYPVTPCRVVDTRGPVGTFGGPHFAAQTSRDFPVRSSACGIPPSAQAYSLNVTVVPRGSLGFLTAWPAGIAKPPVSTLNSLDGTVLANATIIAAGAGGSVSFYAFNATDLVVDINGYFAPPAAGGLNFYASTPCRVVDTRGPEGTFGGPILSPLTGRTFPVLQSACAAPSSAKAYALTATVVPSGSLGYLTVWPAGLPWPNASTLNAPKGAVLANMALVPAGANGAISALAMGATHLVIDILGYFAP
jgi:hypothetical protein